MATVRRDIYVINSPEARGEDGNEALRRSGDRARHAAHVASFNFHLTRYECTPRNVYFCKLLPSSLLYRVYTSAVYSKFLPDVTHAFVFFTETCSKIVLKLINGDTTVGIS